ncbi:dephospho-CoA kinase [Tenacibaculum sp. SG-28]|uniref:dephospho-CoA kinase n=1 Tax=Tenacibaculum sp. SG-28 TaxID=754426 RepID=UPI000CF490F0|nr:dephospho-CoA kinase [Tenacibaculum sp. SG-28]PQJ20750.1 dephospho-CoA kinase [Tenacibaculum sp. SG-28]
MVIGLTGGIGTGKSTVAKLFSKNKNVAIYIADLEAKKLMHSSEIIKTKLIAEFGEACFQNNELQRKHLAKIVFNNKQRLAKLNAIVHPEVHNHFQRFVTMNSSKTYIIYENAILFENNSQALCDKIITVTAPLEDRILRVMKRDDSTRKEVLQRMHNQWSEKKKTLQSNYIISNININETADSVLKIHNILTKNKK